jgi:hemerythrin-like domain-containing protein
VRKAGKEKVDMPVTIGAKLESDFTDPIGLLGDCHRRIERFLGVILAVVEQTGGGPLDNEPRRALGAALRYFREAAPRHVGDEEESLFPRLRQSGHTQAIEALDRLEQDHEAIQAWHEELDGLGERWLTTRRLDEAGYERFATLARRLKDAYEPHVALEDEEVFPLARLLLSEEQLRAVGEEMAGRRAVEPSRPRNEGVDASIRPA